MNGRLRLRTGRLAGLSCLLLLGLLAVALIPLTAAVFGALRLVVAEGDPQVTTDKPDYLSNETVTITGSGFNANTEYDVPVIRPDGSIVKGDGSFTPGWDTVLSDESGAFVYLYKLDGVFGVYEVRVYSADWSGNLAEAPLASTTFTDAAANIDQCMNGGIGNPLEPCKGSTGSAVDGYKNWANGNANGQKAHWREGEFISYRDTIVVDAAGTHVFQIHYGTVHSGKHAIDYLGSFDYAETTEATPTTFHANNNNPCADKLPSAYCVPSSPADSFPIPAATLINCGGSAGGPPASQIAGSFKIWGANSPDITGVSYVAENVASGPGQCSTAIAITFTTTGSGTVVLAWGGHVASEEDWGVGNTATLIIGSPYHMVQDSLTSNDVPQSGVGSQDLALATNAVFFAPTIATVIYSSAIPVPGTPPTVTAGTTVYDTATLSGASGNAGGAVTYLLFDNGTCSDTPASTEDVPVTDAVVPDSSTFTPTTAGPYSYQAVYGGHDRNFPATSICEPLTVQKADTDGDGIPDDQDACPDTPAGAVVDVNGCSQAQVDQDLDGACDPGASSPLWCTGSDNCPDDANPDQNNIDNEDGGDVCDVCPSDDTNTCDTDLSAGESIGPDGGSVTTPDESVEITVPPGALSDDTSISITGGTQTDFELTTNLGQAIGAYAVDIQPSGLVFDQPITIVFAWEDADGDGFVDGTNIKEDNLLITKDNVAITDRCHKEPVHCDTIHNACCDTSANTFTVRLSSLSVFVPAALVPAVGGMVELCGDDDAPAATSNPSSVSDYTLPIAAAAGVVAALGILTAGAWYARRRWLR